MIFALQLIPDFIEKGLIPELIAAGAGLVAVGVIYNYGVRPVFRGGKRLTNAIIAISDWITAIPVHEDKIEKLEGQIKTIHNALAPTNGDRRSISDRLDTVKFQTSEHSLKIDYLTKTVESLRKEQQ